MIDPLTSKRSISRIRDGMDLHLVMSDEFEENDRSFKENQDELFTAIHQPGLTNEEIQFYDSSYVTTKDGYLVLKTTAEKTSWMEYNDEEGRYTKESRNYTSAMLQSWNQFCFTGGVLEMSIQLPGGSAEKAAGLWPAVWLMGNLARAAFPSSTPGIWPWSYDACDGSIDHLANRQEINACSSNPGHGLNPNQGRGSPEIDLFEVNSVPTNNATSPAFMSASLQVAPGVPKPFRPTNGYDLNSSSIWYNNIRMSDRSALNSGFWGQECAAQNDHTQEFKYWEDAVSANIELNNSYFERAHNFRLEWQPGPDGYLEWYVDNEIVLGVEAGSLNNLTGSLIPVEPMYLVFNTAVSPSWGFPHQCDISICHSCYQCFDCHNPDCQCPLPHSVKNCSNFPAEMKIDFIRLYQDPSDERHITDCSPKQYPTQQFIADNFERFKAWSPKHAPTLSSPKPHFVDSFVVFPFMIVVICVTCMKYWRGYAIGSREMSRTYKSPVVDFPQSDRTTENTALLSANKTYM